MSGTNFADCIHRADHMHPRSDYRRDPSTLPELWFEHWEDYYLGEAGYHDQFRHWIWRYERQCLAVGAGFWASGEISLREAGRQIALMNPFE